MVEKDARIQYVPILKWKKGEKVALSRLPRDFRSKIVPLIEIVNDEGDGASDLSEDIKSYWGSGTVYMDTHYRSPSFAYRALNNVSEHVAGIDVIPVVRLDTPVILIDIIKCVAARYVNGAAIRIVIDGTNGFDTLQQEVDLILNKLSFCNNNVDLIIDFSYLKDTAEVYSAELNKITKSLDLQPWRRVIISSGTFPADLTNFKPNAENQVERTEWTNWKKYSDAIGRESVYSDYTVRHAPYLNRSMPGSVSVRYTLDNDYQIFRGKQDDKGFKYLVHAMNIKALYHGKFNEQYSWGDQFIEEKAQQLEDCLKRGDDPETYEHFSPGNAADWVAASVNHHICVVVKDNLRT